MLERISHFGIVVNSMDDALAIWEGKLGFKKTGDTVFPEESIRSVFISVNGTPGEMTIELMEPLDKDDMSNPVARYLKNRGEGFYHLAVVADDIESSGKALEANGFPVIMRPPVGDAKDGRWLIHPKAATGVMIEGIEAAYE